MLSQRAQSPSQDLEDGPTSTPLAVNDRKDSRHPDTLLRGRPEGHRQRVPRLYGTKPHRSVTQNGNRLLSRNAHEPH